MPSSEPMAAADAAWLHMDRPTNRMIIVSVLILEAPLDAARLRRLVARRLVARFPRFRQRVAAGRPLGGARWEEDPDFDLGLHLHRVALPAPGEERALQDGVGDGCALVVRLHHCLADGIALARVMLELTDQPGDRRAERPIAAPPAEERGPSVPALGPLAAPVGAV